MNWLRKKKEKQRNEDEDSIYTGFATAVAAAAFAVRARDAKTQPSMAELPHSNQINNRFSFKKMTTGAQTLSRKATSENEKTADEVKESELKSQRNGKLKSIIDWGTAKKLKGKSKKIGTKTVE